jgi:hypothetical protein
VTAAQRIGKIRDHIVQALAHPVRQPALAAPSTGSPIHRWHLGCEAFGRGELPPGDADGAEGWYWAENEAAQRRI